MDDVLPTILQIAITADLLTRGRGNEMDTHDTIMVYALTAPIGMRNMAK